MKKLILIFVAFLMFACTQEKDKVKVIENYDAQYLTDRQVDSEPGDDTEFERMSDDLQQVIVDNTKDYELPLTTYVHFRLYINEKGEVDGLKELPLPDKKVNEAKNYINIKSEVLMNSIATVAEKWKFNPALKDGKPVKYRGDIEASIGIDENGKASVEIPALHALAKGLSKFNFDDSDEYFVAVEEQPSPIGGLAGIQEKIKYPEKAKINGVQGRVFIKAYINENGEVDAVELLKGIDAECDSVAMAAVEQTKFTPGKQRDKAVKVQVSIPIIFKLQ